MKANPFLSHRRGFSLIELLTVLAIMGLLVGIAGPGLFQLLQGTSLTRAAALVENNLKAAHQYALSQQNDVVVRLYSYIDPTVPNSTSSYRALQLFHVVRQPDGTTANSPLTQVIILPAPNVMIPNNGNEPDYSTLLDPTVLTPVSPILGTDLNIPGVGQAYTYVQFAFRPNGQTNLTGPAGQLYYVTIAASTQAAKPVNFYTIQVDPLTAKITTYRP